MDKSRGSAMGAPSSRSTSQMTLDERREYIAKLRTERQERFGGSMSTTSRPSSSQSNREESVRHLSPTKDIRREPSPTPYSQPSSSSLSMSNLHSTFQGSSLPTRSASPTFPNAAAHLSNSPIPQRSSLSAFPESRLRDSLNSSPLAPHNTFLSSNNNSTFLSQNFDRPPTASNAFSSSFSAGPPDMQTSALDTKQAINSSQRGYNQWAEEKLKWWDAEGKKLQTFLSQLDDEWERHREATRRELEDEISALKHESLVRSNINQASKNLL